jgi:M6 family metalloprotease-like protein
MSFPLFGEQLTFTQPDGTKFDVRAWGDQNNARFETVDGFEIVRDPVTGYFHYATTTPERDELRATPARVAIDAPQPLSLSQGPLLAPAIASVLNSNNSNLPRSRWRDRIEQRKASERLHSLSGGIAPAPPSRHTVGDYLGLCLLIEFSDEPAAVPRDEVDAFCNQVGYKGFGNNGSVFDYYLENSGGRLRYKTLVAPYYTAQRPKSYYVDRTISYGERTRDLIKEALAFHKQQGLDFSALTVDPQEGAYATNVFYAGTVVNNWSEGLWPHASRLAAPFSLCPGVNAVDYQVSAMGSALTLGTYCHENGHMLCDFPDLYQYSDQSRGVGKFCLMCGGGNANPRNPVSVGAYLKYRAGWGTEVQLTAGMRATAEPGANKFFVHSNGVGEYFVLENRQRAGRDAALPGSGLAVWHVDELGSNSNPDAAPLGHRRHECVLVQADGRPDLDVGNNDGDATDLFQAGDAPIFSHTSMPSSRWWDETKSGLQIKSIDANAGTVAFSVEL